MGESYTSRQDDVGTTVETKDHPIKSDRTMRKSTIRLGKSSETSSNCVKPSDTE